ncbi:hypothetical protein B840_00780 [Corynebacterium marinum DSM 44953]|uniref:Uncharacterized protein n=1 Tax=Corynebacterium marinum DSM 44953 TaxID=1224162 RepID=A0A0B6TSR0_9CORY|nr:hypothetical protein B840_00780 [Corynebacterium marinum DSM 44953]
MLNDLFNFIQLSFYFLTELVQDGFGGLSSVFF